MRLLLLIISLFCGVAHATKIKSPDGKTSVDLGFLEVYRCRKDNVATDFEIYDRQGDALFKDSCGATITVSKCLRMKETPKADSYEISCAKGKWKTIQRRKTLMLSTTDHEACFKLVEKKVAELKEKAHVCSEMIPAG